MRKKRANLGTSNAMIEEAVEEWKSVTEMRYELSREAYEFQDDETKAVLDRIRNRLRLGATGYIEVQANAPHGPLVPVKIEQEYLDYNLMYVAVEILKDLAIFDIRVSTFKLPPTLCATCGAELTKEKSKRKVRV